MVMHFIGMIKFKRKLTKEFVEQKMMDTESDTKGQIKYQSI